MSSLTFNPRPYLQSRGQTFVRAGCCPADLFLTPGVNKTRSGNCFKCRISFHHPKRLADAHPGQLARKAHLVSGSSPLRPTSLLLSPKQVDTPVPDALGLGRLDRACHVKSRCFLWRRHPQAAVVRTQVRYGTVQNSTRSMEEIYGTVQVLYLLVRGYALKPP